MKVTGIRPHNNHEQSYNHLQSRIGLIASIKCAESTSTSSDHPQISANFLGKGLQQSARYTAESIKIDQYIVGREVIMMVKTSLRMMPIVQPDVLAGRRVLDAKRLP